MIKERPRRPSGRERHPFQPRLMPLDAYPPDIDSWKRDELDRWLRPRIQKIPTEPGTYADRAEERWVLDANGRWTDHHGEQRPASHSPLLSVFAPFRKVSDDGQA